MALFECAQLKTKFVSSMMESSVSIAALVIGSELHPWLDTQLFHAIHPSLKPGASILATAKVFAVAPLIVAYVVVLLAWIVTRAHKILIEALAAVSAALGFNWFLGVVSYQPRPFLTAGITAWVNHAATSSFPSDHLSIHWCIAGVLLGHRKTRVVGIALALFGLPMAWARIYLGVHYPSDMLGAALFAVCFSSAAVLIGRKFPLRSRLGTQ
jgi:undecaprenyl-diphosphatase